MTIPDLLQQGGITAKKVSSTNGGEYASPCPGCGGHDRFRSWPEQGDGGGWWCRRCGKSGDIIEYLKQFRGLKYLEALTFLGREPPALKARTSLRQQSGKPLGRSNASVVRPHEDFQPSPSVMRAGETGQMNHDQETEQPARESGHNGHAGGGESIQPVRAMLTRPREAVSPPDPWVELAGKFVPWAEEQLAANTKVMDWLAGERGLTPETIKKHHLGWMPRDYFDERERWGLEKVLKDNGRRKKLWIPEAIVLPAFGRDGRPIRLRFRRFAEDGDGPRYYTLPGSSMDPMVLRGDSSAFLVIESEMDALLVDQEVGGTVAIIGLGSATTKPDKRTHGLLTEAERILVSLDNDAAGAKSSWHWWVRAYPQARRWPVVGGKDHTDAWKAGLNLLDWVRAGLQAESSSSRPGPSPGLEATGPTIDISPNGPPIQPAPEIESPPETAPAPDVNDSGADVILWTEVIPHFSCWQCVLFHENPTGYRSGEPGRCTGTPHDGFTARWPAADVGPCFKPGRGAFPAISQKPPQAQGTAPSSYQKPTANYGPQATANATPCDNPRVRAPDVHREGPPYPDSRGMVKCFYCSQLVDGRWCRTRAEVMYGISLLISCSDFIPARHSGLRDPTWASQLSTPRQE